MEYLEQVSMRFPPLSPKCLTMSAFKRNLRARGYGMNRCPWCGGCSSRENTRRQATANAGNAKGLMTVGKGEYQCFPRLYHEVTKN